MYFLNDFSKNEHTMTFAESENTLNKHKIFLVMITLVSSDYVRKVRRDWHINNALGLGLGLFL